MEDEQILIDRVVTAEKENKEMNRALDLLGVEKVTRTTKNIKRECLQ